MTSTALPQTDADIEIAAPTRRDLDNVFFLEWIARHTAVYTASDGTLLRVIVHRGAYLDVRSVTGDPRVTHTLYDVLSAGTRTTDLSVGELRPCLPLSRLPREPRLRVAAERQRRRLWPAFMRVVREINARTDIHVAEVADVHILRFARSLGFSDLVWFAEQAPQIGPRQLQVLFEMSPRRATRLIEQWVARGEVARLAVVPNALRDVLYRRWGSVEVPRLWRIADALADAGWTTTGEPVRLPTCTSVDASSRLANAQVSLTAPADNDEVMEHLVKLAYTASGEWLSVDECLPLLQWIVGQLPTRTPLGEQAYLRCLAPEQLQHDATEATRWCRRVLRWEQRAGAAIHRAYVDSAVASSRELGKNRPFYLAQHVRIALPDGRRPGVMIVRQYKGLGGGLRDVGVMRADATEEGIAAMKGLGWIVGFEAWLAMPEAERDARAAQWCTGEAA